MTDTEKKVVAKMAKDICLIPRPCDRCEIGELLHNECKAKIYAQRAYDKGYRKQDDVIDEFAERLKEAPIKCGLPLLGLSTKEEIEEYFDGVMLQVREAIDNIAKEMKGD